MPIRAATVPDDEAESRGGLDEILTAFLRARFPVHCRYWDDDTLLEIVRFGKERALQYGLTKQADVCAYVGLLPILGGRFDEDPMLPWATSVLHDKSIRDPSERISRLSGRVKDYQETVCGKHNEHLRDCANMIRTSWQHLLVRAGQVDPQTGLVFLMERTFPRKWAKAPLQLLPQFASVGMRRATTYEIRSSTGMILYLSFAFLFGWKFDEDPLLPMFTSVLRQSPATEATKERLLYERLAGLAETVAREPSPKDRARE